MENEATLAYGKALAAIKAADAVFHPVRDAYRARKVSDAEFLAAQAAHKVAEAAFDVAFAAARDAQVGLPPETCKGCHCEAVDGLVDGYCSQCANVCIHWGYTRAQLSEAFDRVKSPENWKLPIDATLEGRLSGPEKTVIEAAVIFYAGCSAIFTTEIKGRGYSTRVRAAGYYAAVGA